MKIALLLPIGFRSTRTGKCSALPRVSRAASAPHRVVLDMFRRFPGYQRMPMCPGAEQTPVRYRAAEHTTTVRDQYGIAGPVEPVSIGK